MRTFLILISYLAFFRSAPAQDLNNLQLASISSKDGLSHSTVNCVVKDSLGFLWIGTMDGLNRFDGNNIEVFKTIKGDSTSLHSHTVWSLLTTENNEIWIGTSYGLARYSYDTGHFEKINIEGVSGNNSIRSMVLDQKGNIWASSLNKGMIHINRSESPEKISIRFLKDLNPEFRNKSFNPIATIAIDGVKSNIIWLCGGDQLLEVDIESFELVSHTQHLRKLGLDKNKYYGGVLSDHDGIIWMSSDENGLYRYDPIRQNLNQYLHDPKNPKSIKSNDLFRVFQDKQKRIWVSSLESGISCLEDWQNGVFVNISNTSIDKNYSVSKKISNAFFDDDTAWFCSHGDGLQYISTHQRTFELYKHTDSGHMGLPPGYISSIYEDQQGYTWVGSKGTGVTKIKLGEKPEDATFVKTYFATTNDTSDKKIGTFITLFEDDEYGLMVGARLAGLHIYDQSKDRLRPYLQKPGDLDLIQEYHVNVIKKLSNRDIIMGTRQGIFYWNRASGTLIDFNASHPDLKPLSNYYVTAIHEFEKKLFIGTGNNGAYIWDFKKEQLTKFEHYVKNIGTAKLDAILSFHDDGHGVFWIGTWGGSLIKYNVNKNEISLLDEQQGLNNNVVYSIQADAYNRLWISTNKGISSLDKSTERFTNYSISDGLQGEEFNSRVGYQSLDGKRIYFGGMQGFNIVRPAEITKDSLLPNVHLLSLDVFKQNQKGKIKKNLFGVQQIKLDHESYLLNFKFGAPKLSGNQDYQFAYQIQGLSSNWINIGARQDFQITGLSAGNYKLNIRAIGNSGFTNDNYTTLKIVSLPPWWQTWLAYVLYLMIAGAVLYAIYYNRVSQLIKYRNLRTQISSDLHDDVGTLLSTIAFQSEIMELEHQESEQKEFNKLSKLSRLAMSRMRDTVWAMDARKDNPASLVARMNDFLFDTFEHQEIRYTFDKSITNNVTKLAPDVRQALYLIFKEAITNALKHTNGDLVTIHLNIQPNTWYLHISDNGQIDASKIKSSGLGLDNMRTRAAKIGAKFEIKMTSGFSISVTKN